VFKTRSSKPEIHFQITRAGLCLVCLYLSCSSSSLLSLYLILFGRKLSKVLKESHNIFFFLLALLCCSSLLHPPE
ncbi:hypothetical protein AGIG_G26917, partial [Arapaima gigas]